MGFGSFIFTNKDWDYEQSSRITLGIGVKTFFTGLIMTSIASLFSTFFSKIKYLIFTMGFAFSIMFVSFLGTYSVENEVKYLGEREAPVQLQQFLNIKGKKNSYVSGFDELYVKILDDGESLQSLFNKSKFVTYFNNFAKYDPGTKLSSLFTLNRTSKNFTLQYCLQELINNPFEIVLDDGIKIDDYVISNLEYGLGNGKSGKVSLIPKISFIIDAYLKKRNKYLPKGTWCQHNIIW